eukprot:SAG11_NODE_12782_length_685_cov_1.467577_1_plen_96_part_00
MDPTLAGGRAEYQVVFEGTHAKAVIETSGEGDIVLRVNETGGSSATTGPDIEVATDTLGEDRTDPPGDLWDRRAIKAAVEQVRQSKQSWHFMFHH